MLFSAFQLSLGVRSVWPKHMGLKAFFFLYILLLLASLPVTLLSWIPYGLFGLPAAVCIYGLVTCRETAAQNVCMGMIGFVLAILADNLLSNVQKTLIPVPFLNQPYVSLGVDLIYILLFYLITLFGGRLIKKLLLSDKGILHLPQTWYLMDAGVLLLITTYLFDDLLPGQDGSVGRMLYTNGLHILGYLLVMLFLFLAVRVSYLEKMQTEMKQNALRDLLYYTRNLETMYNGL